MKRENQQADPAQGAGDSICMHIPSRDVEGFVAACLEQAGADRPSTEAVSRSLVGASLRGVDSHGIRLLPHYIRALRGGRINGSPKLSYQRLSAGTGRLDADDGFGHLAGYRAIEEGMRLAEENGLGAVTVVNSSHFGAAGSYTLAAAEAGYMAFAISNSDKLVLPFDGVRSFHGTNPFSFAAPVEGQRPFLLDMATSAIPLNRVLQYRAIDRPLPCDVAVDADGHMTTDPAAASALLPVGGADYGYKGAGLAALCEVLSAALTGMGFSHQLLSMAGPDYTTRRHLGHFFLVMKLQAFLDPRLYWLQMSGYLQDLRGQQATAGKHVMAPGDREWAEERDRLASGIPIDHAVQAEFAELAATYGLAPLGEGIKTK